MPILANEAANQGHSNQPLREALVCKRNLKLNYRYSGAKDGSPGAKFRTAGAPHIGSYFSSHLRLLDLLPYLSIQWKKSI